MKQFLAVTADAVPLILTQDAEKAFNCAEAFCNTLQKRPGRVTVYEITAGRPCDQTNLKKILEKGIVTGQQSFERWFDDDHQKKYQKKVEHTHHREHQPA